MATFTLVYTDALTGLEERVIVDRTRAIERCTVFRDMYENAKNDRGSSSDILLGQVMASASVRLFANAINNESWPLLTDSVTLFTESDVTNDDKVTHFNAAALAFMYEFDALIGFYVNAFANALAEHGKDWFCFEISRVPIVKMGKRPRSPSADSDTSSLSPASKKQHTLPGDGGPLSVPWQCVACGNLSTGMCSECRSVAVCSEGCLAVVHPECFGFHFVPIEGEKGGACEKDVPRRNGLSLLSEMDAPLMRLIRQVRSSIIMVGTRLDSKDLANHLIPYSRESEESGVILTETAISKHDIKALLVFLINGISYPERHLINFLTIAATWGVVDMVKSILADPRVGKRPIDGAVFFLAVRWGDEKSARLILADPRVDFSYIKSDFMYAMYVRASLDLWRLVLSDNRIVPRSFDGVLIRAVAANKVELMRLLLAHPRIDPSEAAEEMMTDAISMGHIDILEMLLAHPRIDPRYKNGRALIDAVRSGDVDVVRILLADPRIDPTVSDNQAIVSASSNGYVGIVRLLLADKRVDPMAGPFPALAAAIWQNNIEVVRVLLEDGRFDATNAFINVGFGYAVKEGRFEVARLLLNDGRIRPDVDNNEYIRWVSNEGNTDMVRLLLEDPRVDPSANDNEAVRKASENGHSRVVRLLISDPRVTLSTEEKVALYEQAVRNENK